MSNMNLLYGGNKTDLASGDFSAGKKDYVTALFYYRNAAKNNNHDAQVRLGVFYAEGKGVGQDHSAAAYWYKLAAEQGNKWAQLFLGKIFLQG